MHKPRKQPYRLSHGGVIERSWPIDFTYDNHVYQGYPGDTLASALLANGIRVVARSFKYHRPRGIYSAGSEEPNALLTLHSGERREPNTRATVVELYRGLQAYSQNCWPSVGFDLGAVNNWLSPFFAAGFYYKTFMWPGPKGWLFYEHFIRKAAGLGRSSLAPDPDRYERIEAFCDVLIVGAGPAGLAAALAAGLSGARVMLVDESAFLGGAISQGRDEPDSDKGPEWVAQVTEALRSLPEVKILTRATAFGYYDGNVVGLVERVSDHLPEPAPYLPRQRHWIVRARRVVLATGAIERPLLFVNNDLPGVMLAASARTYLNRYAVCPGERALIYTNNDSAYLTALDLVDAGKQVTVIDPRPQTSYDAACRQAGIELQMNTMLVTVKGNHAIKAAVVQPCQGGKSKKISCDWVLSSGGWSPTIHLHSQAGDKPVFDGRIQGFVPGKPREAWLAAGACTGEWSTAKCIQQGADAGQSAAGACGFEKSSVFRDSVFRLDETPSTETPSTSSDLMPFWQIPDKGKCFIDLQNDVTSADIDLAQREGYASVELSKRYTTLGMATDQGKTGNLNGLAVLASHNQTSIPEVGVTTYRPPYTPVTMGAIAGRKSGAYITPVRRTPMHNWHIKSGAPMTDAGHWKRAQYYPKENGSETHETRRQAAIREAAHARSQVGITDVSTLGKIDVQGPDAAEFLERVYVNRWRKLAVGKARYGIMLREDGLVYDDGTTTHVDKNNFFMTTTTAQAAGVLRHLEYLLQLVWPRLKVAVTSVTDQWAGIALAGPKSRAVLQALVDASDVSDAALPFMGMLETSVNGMPVRVLRISFSGELAYEIYVPANHGEAVWVALLEAGKPHEIMPYGLDAMDILRIEKGHVTGAEIDGNRTLDDLGLSKMAYMEKDFIGRAMMSREGFRDGKRPKLVGLQSVDLTQRLSAGAHVVRENTLKEPCESWGHVSSTCYSPTLKREIGLGFLRGGQAHIGETFYASDPLGGRHVAVEIVAPHFVDPQGERLRG